MIVPEGQAPKEETPGALQVPAAGPARPAGAPAAAPAPQPPQDPALPEEAHQPDFTRPDVALANSVRLSLAVAPASGDKEARARAIAKSIGAPLESVRALPDEAERKRRVEEVMRVLGDHPATWKVMTDSSRAALAADNVESLTSFEERPRVTGEMRADSDGFFVEMYNAVQRGFGQAHVGFARVMEDFVHKDGSLRRAQREASGGDPSFDPDFDAAVRLANLSRQADTLPASPRVAAGMQAIAEAETMGAAFSAAMDNPRAVLEMTVQSFAASAPTIAIGAAGGVWAAIVAGLAQEYGASVQEALGDAKVDVTDPDALARAHDTPEVIEAAQWKATLRAIPIAIAEALTLRFAGTLLRGAGPGLASKAARVTGEGALQAGGGMTGEAVAQAITGDYKPGEILLEGIAELPTALVDVPANWVKARLSAEGAEARARQIDEDLNLAAAQRLRERDPEAFEQFAKDVQVSQGKIRSVFVDAQVFHQLGIAKDAADVSPAVAKQLPAATATGGQVEIPLAEYEARIAGTKADEALRPHLRTSPVDFSKAEAGAAKEQLSAELKEDMHRKLREAGKVTPALESRNDVFSRVFKALRRVGKPTDVAKAEASLPAHFYAAMGQRLGVLASEVFEMRPLSVIGPADSPGEVARTGRVDTSIEGLGAALGDGRPTKLRDVEGPVSVGQDISLIGVRDGSFIGAVVPSTAPPEVYERLAEAGITDVRTYDAGNAQDRADAMAGFSDGFFQATGLRRRRETLRRYGLVPGQRYSTRQVAAALEARQRAKYGTIARDDHGAEALTRVAHWLAEEVAFEMESPETSGMGWYSVEYQDSLDMLGGVYPELLTDKSARNIMTALLAITSDGQSPIPNMAHAVDIYGRFRDGGATPGRFTSSRGHFRDASIQKNMARLQRLLRELGPEGLHEYLMQEMTVRDLRALAQKHGGSVSSDYPASMVLPMAAVEFGPKLGAFYANLMGAHGYLTMDRWWSRTLNRLRGVLLTAPTKLMMDAFSALVGRPGMQPDEVMASIVEPQARFAARGYQTMAALLVGRAQPADKASRLRWEADLQALDLEAAIERLSRQAEEAITAANAPGPHSAKVKKKALQARAVVMDLADLPAGITASELLRLHHVDRRANNIHKAAFVSLEDAPFVAADRSFMTRATKRAQANLKRRGIDVSIADIQAILWFYEKKLYGELGARQSPIVGFKDAARRVLEVHADTGNVAALLGDDGETDAIAEEGVIAGLPPGEGEFNEDEIIYEQRRGSVRGWFQPNTSTIALLKGHDLSTWLHESGHFFLESTVSIAAALSQKPGDRSAGELSVLADAQKLMDWFGLRNLDEWDALSVAEKRSYHERFAESFELYLMEGKAPSIELIPEFRRFASWLKQVYKSIRDFLTKHPQAGLLNDDIRGVMDRMLATDEQIAMARKARSMAPLFATPEDAGITPAEFSAIQQWDQESIDAADEELRKKALRDMRLLRGARGRALKRLQAEAITLRRDIRAEVRTRVLTRPIYRAWAFLTAPISEQDRALMTATMRPASGPGALDPKTDSLFIAVAKLGGVSLMEVAKELGVDPALLRIKQPLFNRPVLRKSNGMSLVAMSQALAEHGYLPQELGPEQREGDLTRHVDAFLLKFQAEMNGNRVYSTQAHDSLLTGDDGAPAAGTPEFMDSARLSIPSLKAMGIDPSVIANLARKGIAREVGVHPELVAGLFEIASGERLVSLLAEAHPPGRVIEKVTDRLMLERHGELATPEAVERAADEAVHNDMRLRVIEAEVAALDKATGMQHGFLNAIKAFAAEMVLTTRLADLRHSKLAAIAERAGMEAERAFRKGERGVAAAEKRTQALYTHATRLASKATTEVSASLVKLKKLTQARYRKRIPLEYLEQIDAILEHVSLTRRSNRSQARLLGLRAWVEQQRASGFDPPIAEWLLEEVGKRNYRDMTVEEFRGLMDSVMSIVHLARTKNRLLKSRRKKEFALVEAELARNIIAHGGQAVPRRAAVTDRERRTFSLRSFIASHLKASSILHLLDGSRVGGPLWSVLGRTANASGDREAALRSEYTDRLVTIMAPVLARGPMEVDEVNIQGVVGRSLNRMQRFAIALNAGNAGNRQRLLDGEGWTPAVLDQVMATLTADELLAVQGIWDLFESIRPEVEALERRLYNRQMELVEATPMVITSADGERVELRGGYYPVRYDDRAGIVPDGTGPDGEVELRRNAAVYTRSVARRDFAKSRARKVVGKPLLLTLDGVFEGLNEVIHYISWQEWLIDANRLLRSEKVDRAIRVHYAHGPEMLRALSNWTRDIAAGDHDGHHEGAAHFFRRNIALSGLGYNLMTAAIQFTGVFNSAERVGWQRLMQGTAEYLSNPARKAAEMNAMSSFMANRMQTAFRELLEVRRLVRGDNWVTRNIQANAFILIAIMQRQIDIPTWYAAYNQALADGRDSAEAVAIADQVVIDTQGSGMLKDMALVERGTPVARLLTVFYSYMAAVFNLIHGVAASKAPLASKAVRLLALVSGPVFLTQVARNALTPDIEDETEEERWEKFGQSMVSGHISYLLGTMIYLRELAAISRIISGEQGPRAYEGPSGLKVIGDVYGLINQTAQLDLSKLERGMDPGFDKAFRRELINVVGFTSGLPAAQLNRTMDGIDAWMEEETEDPRAVLFGAPR